VSKEVKLLPCPFCGGAAKPKHNGGIKYWVGCVNQKCFAKPNSCDPQNLDKVIEGWNTRASTAERDKAIARAAFMAGAIEYMKQKSNYTYLTADDYLNSEEFKELSGAKSLSGLVK
jgi:hypothetical protein